jgi:hypothetical protein
MRALVLVVVLLSTTVALADRDAQIATRRELIAALAKRDVATIKARAQLPLQVSGLWFDTVACKKFSGKEIEVGADQLAELVGCLADLGVQLLDDQAFIAATYGPGVMLAVVVPGEGKQLTSLRGFTTSDGAAMIHPQLFASHVAKFEQEIVPDAATKQTIDKGRDTAVQARIVVCVDGRGTVEDGHTADATLVDGSAQAQPVASYARAVEKVVAGWKIQPFVAHGKPVALACAVMPLGYPSSRIEPLAPDWPAAARRVAAARNVAPTVLETTRIRGNKVIVPDETTKKEMLRVDKRQVVGSWKMCLDETGAVAEVTRIKSTGFEAYDKRISSEMRTWAYRPYVIDGKPVRVCTAITFIYSQD